MVLLKPPGATDDTYSVIVNESLIQDAVLMASPDDLDDVLTAVEAYRICIQTARRLQRSTAMEVHRQQLLECAVFCEAKLTAFTETGRLGDLQYPQPGLQCGHFVLSMKW